MLIICIWDKLTISPPLGFDIYSAQQAESLWYHVYVLYSISCKTEGSTDMLVVQLLTLLFNFIYYTPLLRN